MFDLTEYRQTIEIIRIANHLSRSEVAKEIGIAYHTYLKSMIEDSSNISPITLKKLKKFIDKHKN